MEVECLNGQKELQIVQENEILEILICQQKQLQEDLKNCLQKLEKQKSSIILSREELAQQIVTSLINDQNSSQSTSYVFE
ncbi:hypothetical protein SS50377_21179 [Spironucleus salmonicida]|uniref:Uncharacterized protein n=1 Tax=Spironucleus salmonicida TaxID=348837 RepID=A0A9P8M0S1_9EUKA|nr:hypothetical protein SS50377_21179 [Spironucleus salmonicida]